MPDETFEVMGRADWFAHFNFAKIIVITMTVKQMIAMFRVLVSMELS